MKVAILAGGRGTRFAEETDIKPKPMITIGGFPLIWHIMKYFAEFSCDN
ncbi:MAG: NTP transferase domain-containing protein, partial [Planctomycetaceae bacterium]|nr:NTP transferase domain-containing protein [Planctomycetaceae bacterium]